MFLPILGPKPKLERITGNPDVDFIKNREPSTYLGYRNGGARQIIGIRYVKTVA